MGGGGGQERFSTVCSLGNKDMQLIKNNNRNYNNDKTVAILHRERGPTMNAHTAYYCVDCTKQPHQARPLVKSNYFDKSSISSKTRPCVISNPGGWGGGSVCVYAVLVVVCGGVSTAGLYTVLVCSNRRQRGL